jgi:hypothetical protein
MMFWRRLLAALRRDRLDDDLREDLAQHVAWQFGLAHGERMKSSCCSSLCAAPAHARTTSNAASDLSAPLILSLTPSERRGWRARRLHCAP